MYEVLVPILKIKCGYLEGHLWLVRMQGMDRYFAPRREVDLFNNSNTV